MKKFFSVIAMIAAVMFSATIVSCGGTHGNKTTAYATVTSAMLEELNLDGVYNLMIVAHPDDETLWGGKYLIEEEFGDFFVVVVTTDFGRLVRIEELDNAMNHINNHANKNHRWLKLAHADSVGGFNDALLAEVRRDVETLLDFKNWNKIVTHNPIGEYTEFPWFGGVGNGHPQHIQLNQVVTETATERGMLENLYVFVYHQQNTTEGLTQTVREETVEMIRYIIVNKFTHDSGLWGLFGHHIPFQQVVRATEWVDEREVRVMED